MNKWSEGGGSAGGKVESVFGRADVGSTMEIDLDVGEGGVGGIALKLKLARVGGGSLKTALK